MILLKVILQTNQSDCLLACAAMIMETYGCKIPVYKLVEKVELSMAGSTVLQLKETLEEFGFTVNGYRLDKEKLNQTQFPLIAYVNNGHFIVINKVRKNRIIGIDPAIGRIGYTIDEFSKMYSGVVIKIQKSNLTSTQVKSYQTNILSPFKNKKIVRILIGLFVASIFTQIVAMSYSYMYSVVGEGGTYYELVVLILLAVLLLGVGSVLQGILTKKFNILYEQIFGNNLIDKLMDKNFKFFSFRSNGDLLYRINARGTIKDALLLKLVPSFIALCTIVFVQGILFVQSFFLGTIFLLAVLLYLFTYIGISRIAYMESNKYTQKIIQLNTTSENIIRGISTIKVLNVEKIFMDKWHNENQTQAECYGQLVIIQSIQSVITNIFTYIVPIAVSIISIISNEDKSIFSQIALLPLLYLVAGAGSTMIARELNEQGIMTIKGNPWVSSSIMGIINNEKYKGDILLGKTFTVDPISKRRLENLGEEDRYYIHNHHEPIISEEMFARAQEIRSRRNGNRKHGAIPGKREKFSRQYAFSCLLECGFCGGNLSRRRWHSNSKYKKTIWQCVKATKEGKRFCPDSKGIPEQVIEEAFVESYRMLCRDNKDVIEEFLKRTEKALEENSTEDQLNKLQKKIDNLSYKRKKLLDNYLSGIVEKDIYEETDVNLKTDLSNTKAKLVYFQQQADEEGSLQRRIADFKKALSQNEVLEEFDRGIFESIIEKVIVGGYDEYGEKDPYKITFIYKTGFKNEIGNAKKRFGKSAGVVDKAKKMCSDVSDKVKDVYSNVSDNTR